jgi:tripartite-type tricarboxylate transporter receptor subunit TctC
MKGALLSCLAASLVTAMAGAWAAESWPARPIRLRKLHAETMATLKLPEIQKWFASEGAVPADMTTAQFSKFILSEMVKWGKVVKRAGIRPE